MPDTPRNPRAGTALITGASSGLGAAYARALAARGWDLVLVARRRERLEELAAELRAAQGGAVEVLVADLLRPEEWEAVARRLQGEDVAMLINNAGFGVVGEFAEAEIERQLEMVRLHVETTLVLTRAALPGMIRRGRGYVINVASVAAFLPVGGNPTYSASKAFLTVWSTALQEQVRAGGVRVQALCPGLTLTEFHSTPEYTGREREVYPRWLWQTTEQVVGESLRALRRERVVVVTGWLNRLGIALTRHPGVARLLYRRAARPKLEQARRGD